MRVIDYILYKIKVIDYILYKIKVIDYILYKIKVIDYILYKITSKDSFTAKILEQNFILCQKEKSTLRMDFTSSDRIHPKGYFIDYI